MVCPGAPSPLTESLRDQEVVGHRDAQGPAPAPEGDVHWGEAFMSQGEDAAVEGGVGENNDV